MLLSQIDADADGAVTEAEYLASVGKQAATVAELKAALVSHHKTFDGAWEHLSDDDDARMDRGAFLSSVHDLGISNGEAIWQRCFGAAQSVDYHTFAEAFGEAVTLPESYLPPQPTPFRHR